VDWGVAWGKKTERVTHGGGTPSGPSKPGGGGKNRLRKRRKMGEGCKTKDTERSRVRTGENVHHISSLNKKHINRTSCEFLGTKKKVVDPIGGAWPES